MNKRLYEALWRKALKDFEFYAWGRGDFRGFAFTLDEHDAAEPLKHLPDRPQLRVVNEVYEQAQRLGVVKSRQLMVSWFFCTRFLWECFNPGRRFLVCCKREEDADALLARMWTQYEQIPQFLRPQAVRKEAHIIVKHPNGGESRIQAAAQNTDAARSFTFSAVWVDESAFTDNLADLVAGAGPTTMNGGKLVLTTTPNGREYTYNLITDGGRVAL